MLSTEAPEFSAPPTTPPFSPYSGFGSALRTWLVTADRNQEALARAVQVEPSAVTSWMQGRKRPDGRSLVRLLLTFRRWIGGSWSADDALDGISLAGWSWETVLSAANHLLQPGGDLDNFQAWWQTAGRTRGAVHLPPPLSFYVNPKEEDTLKSALLQMAGYRAARWRGLILTGLAGSGKTALVRALADDAQVLRAFRDGVLWIDGSRQPKKEAKRLCLALGLERAPGEHWVECWQRWAGASERRCLLIIDDATPGPTLTSFVAGLGSQVVVLVTTQLGIEIRAEVAPGCRQKR